MKTKNLFKQVFQVKETNCTIISDKESAVNIAMFSIRNHRKELEKYIRCHPNFLYSLKPVSANDGPVIVELMAEVAEKANVGPMAAVAGVLADLAVEDMVLAGSKIAVVENGGEVSAFSNKPIDVALLAGDTPLSKQIGFRIEKFPTGVATSSGLFSHALSFGEAEAVTIFSTNAGLADAAATAVGNLIKGKDWRRAVERGIEEALSIDGVKGVFIVYRGIVGQAGEVAKIIKVIAEETDDRTSLSSLKQVSLQTKQS
jgi:ApbE superfamily uncharacterized protein (UPF0280 family)